MEHLFDPAPYTQTPVLPTPHLRQPGSTPGKVSRYLSDQPETLLHTAQFGRPSIRFPERIVPALAASGRFKSQFETDTSEGALAPEWRAIVEQGHFGYPKTMPSTQRPIYGYFDRSGDTLHGTPSYGEVKAVLKPSVLPRTTVTYGDSLAQDVYPLTHAQAYHPPPGTAMAGRYGAPYVEAQYHGGLSLGDVEHLEFTHEPYPLSPRFANTERATEEANFITRAGQTAAMLGKPHRVLRATPMYQEPLPAASPHNEYPWTRWARNTGNATPPVIHSRQFTEIARSPGFKSVWGP